MNDAKTHPLAPWFEAVADLIGPTAAAASGGRVAKICQQMKRAGVTPGDLDRLPSVIAAYAPWRKVIDVGAVQACWPWLLDPPAAATLSPIGLAVRAIQDNGGKEPF